MPVFPALVAGYAHLTAHAALSAVVALLTSLLHLPSRLLEGLHTYIHPDTLGSSGDGLRAAIRRPSDPAASADQQTHLRRRPRSAKDAKSVFDEASAQLLRLRLVDSHLRTRLYFPQYNRTFLATAIAASSLLLSRFLPDPSSAVALAAAVPLLSSLLASSYVFFSLTKLSFERSATKKSERQLAAVAGSLGFVVALLILSVLSPSVFDFGLGSGALGLLGVAASVVAGCLAGLLFVPATRAARSLWLGTDQLRWNLEVISCGTVTRVLLYMSYIVGAAAPLMWIKPVVEIPARDSQPEKFQVFRVWLLAASSALQLVVLRPNVQTYLNEAVVSWYQRLHASKVPDLDFGRAKVFLHNYYLCLVALQFFAAPAMGTLFLGLSQTRGNLCGLTDSSCLVAKETALFLSWWIAFIWAIYTTSTLVLLRWGFLLIS